MERGKFICNHLRAIRQKIADENGIPFEQRECTHKGDCRGTCPRCEAEVHYLEQALTSKLNMGKVATVAGLSLSLAACGGSDESTLQSRSPLKSLETKWFTNNPLTHEDSLEIEGFEEETQNPPDTFPEISSLGLILEYDSSTTTQPTEHNPLSDSLSATAVDNEDELIEGEIFIIVEKEAEFPGGIDALQKYIAENINYPEEAQKNGITGTVFIKFIVEKDGSISQPHIIREIGGGCGNEALRVVKNMPKWRPAIQSGKSVRMEFLLPIQFESK